MARPGRRTSPGLTAGAVALRAYRALLLAWAAATLLGFLYAMANPFGVPW